MILEGDDEQVIIPCSGCRVPILTWWAPNNRGLMSGEYVLVADWIYHPKCFDILCEDMDKALDNA